MAKLFVIPARNAPIAAIIRRGPSAWYHLIRWDTRRDQFEHGAWFKGRIYEDKCDLSPDGALFLYFVHQGSRGETKFTHAWTAVSRFPWLTAIAVWPQGTTYGGGGRFIGARDIALRAFCYDSGPKTHPDYPPRGLRVVDAEAELHRSADLVPDADWSGYDFAGKIIYTKGDGVYRRERRTDRLVADFSELKPDPQPPPHWAEKPLVSGL